MLVDGRDLAQWREAVKGGVTATFCESPSNPGLELVDLKAVAELSHEAGGVFIIDNVFASPLLQHPLQLGADIVVYSATKHIDGQGRSLGGAVLGSRKYIVGHLRAVPAPYRSGAVAVQCLALGEGARDPAICAYPAMQQRARDREVPRGSRARLGRALSRPR